MAGFPQSKLRENLLDGGQEATGERGCVASALCAPEQKQRGRQAPTFPPQGASGREPSCRTQGRRGLPDPALRVPAQVGTGRRGGRALLATQRAHATGHSRARPLRTRGHAADGPGLRLPGPDGERAAARSPRKRTGLRGPLPASLRRLRRLLHTLPVRADRRAALYQRA